jgi:L-2-hydroxyglutarate oxidase
LSEGYDLVVIGGGIVGLALADSWLTRNPGDKVLVLEKESVVAFHASGRNSGVLHAGFYYAPDSIKAKLTRSGNQKLREFCYERGIPIVEAGKVVVTKHHDEIPALVELNARAIANGCTVEIVDEAQLAEIEPLARTHGKALWSPLTAVSSPTQVTESLAKRVGEKKGEIRLSTQVTGAGPGWVEINGTERIAAGHIINAAGLYADRVAHWFEVGLEYKMMPFKGLYWYGNWEKGRMKRHVYPVPDPRNPFLGVHTTVTVDGTVKLGPTAIPALWREDYGHLSSFKIGEMSEILSLFPRFLRSKYHDVPALIRSEFPKYIQRNLVRQVQALVPSVNSKDFRTKGRPGIRAQLLHTPTGKLEMDFVVQSGDRSTHILNAVSPAWTSSLAVGEYVVGRIHDGGF